MKDEEKAREYQEILDYLFGLQKFGIKLGLKNIRVLLKELGEPHVGLKAVHIAGSNGKGSTAAFLDSILRQAGRRVGLYTSPHLVDFNERIRLNGVPIPRERVAAETRRIRDAWEKMAREGSLWSDPALLPQGFDPKRATITFFEFTTAMALLYFREERADIAILETGMGGRLDATNVIDPLMSLITSISLEHQQYLGSTLLEIAREKAGIIKPGRPLLTTARQPRVRALFQERCRELKAPFFAYGRDFSARELRPGTIRFRGRKHVWPEFSLGLLGPHQVVNASLALAAVEILLDSGWAIEEEHLRRGLAEATWPGRLELIGDGPRILLDGAHNPEGVRALRKALRTRFAYRRLILVLGIMADKSIARMMADLVPLADLLILTRPNMDRAATLESLEALASPFQKPVLKAAPVDEALRMAIERAGEEDLVLVSGSLFTVGEARAYLQKATPAQVGRSGI